MGSTRRLESRTTKMPPPPHEKNVFSKPLPFLQVLTVNTEYLALNLPYTGCHIQGQCVLPALCKLAPKMVELFQKHVAETDE